MLSTIAERTDRGNEETLNPGGPSSDHEELVFPPEVQDASESRVSGSASASGASTTYDKINENQMMPD